MLLETYRLPLIESALYFRALSGIGTHVQIEWGDLR